MDMQAARALVAAAELELVRVVESAANARLAEAVAEFRRRHPTWNLRIIFGNGIEAGTIELPVGGSRSLSFIDGEARVGKAGSSEWDLYSRAYRSLQFLADAISDVIELTDGYRKGCPEDVETRSR